MANIVNIALYNIIIPLLVLSTIILVHEAGHFLTALKFGVGVKEFALGMGPRIFSVRKKKALYSIRLIPIGGFVSMVGEDEKVNAENSFSKKPLFQRFIILISGSVMNIILGFIIMTVIVSASKDYASTKIVQFDYDSLSNQSGLQKGDIITKIGSKKINIADDIYYTVARLGNEPVDITVIRDDKSVVVREVKFPVIEENDIRFGRIDFSVERQDKTFSTVVKQAFFRSYSTVDLVFSSLYDLVTGRFGLNAFSGPIGLTQNIGETAKAGGASTLFLLVVIVTINAGIMNVLPLPGLDGGRIMFLIVELVRGRPIKPEHEGYVHLVGVFLLLSFMVIITYNDILRYFHN